MRTSLILTAVIVLLAAGLGRIQEKRIRETRRDIGRLEAEAAELGIPGKSSNRRTTTKTRDRGVSSRDIAGLATALKEALRLDPKERWKNGRETLIARIEDLDRAGFEELLGLLGSGADASTRDVKGLIELVIYKYAMLHHQAGLDFLVSHPEMFEEGSGFRKDLVRSALHRWRENPEAALRWYRENCERMPELDAGIKFPLVTNFAYQNPHAAFGVLEELGLGPEAAMGIFVSSGLEHRREALDGFRKYAERIDDPKERQELWEKGLKSVGMSVSHSDFDSARRWIDTADLSPEDRKVLAANLTVSNLKPAEAEKWISWIAENAGDQSAGPIRKIVSDWTTQDFPAASEWLAALPAEDPAKEASIAAYAEIVSSYHPETAARWAEQLPPGDARNATLRAVYERWPRKDDASKAAAEVFGEAHGIE